MRSRLDTNGTVRHFVHDGWHVVNELDETERVQASYIRGHEWLTQLDDQGDVAYYVNNIHGDVTHLTGQQGEILNAYTYDAFGNMLSAREQRVNPFRYAGEMQDALTGHYYLRARFYNPLIARFTQEDTYRGDGLNLYAYVATNPIRYVDPSGYAKARTLASCVNKGQVIDPNNKVVEITLTYKDGMPINEFLRKATTLQQLGEQGLLVKAQNPVKRDSNITKSYKSEIIKKIWNQYSTVNREFADKLINRVKHKMQPDHVWELQLNGPDLKSNLKLLDSYTNWDIGTMQIRPQIKNLPVGTEIRIIIEGVNRK